MDMPAIQGLSKAAANYRRADNPKFSCRECKFMFPEPLDRRMPVRPRRDPPGGHLRRVRASTAANGHVRIAALLRAITSV